MKETFAGKTKMLFFIIFSSLLTIETTNGVIAGLTSSNTSVYLSTSHVVVKSSCSSTLYPELCYSSIASISGGVPESLRSKKDVIELSINITCEVVWQNYFTISKLIKYRKNVSHREKEALHDCLEMVDETLDQLHEARDDLKVYPSKTTLAQQASHLKTLVSAAITNQDTCLDGFSYNKADKIVRDALVKGQQHVHKMCSNVLAMVKNLTDTDMENERYISGRKLEETVDNASLESQSADGFPEWLSEGDRRLLHSTTVTVNATVAADGSGDFSTVSAAVAAAPLKSTRRYIIRIKAGVYRENVEVPKKKTNLMFLGDGRKKTIITGSKNVVDGSTTFKSATVAIVGNGFLAKGITFKNTAGPSKHQAVALRVGSDLSAFYECDIIAYQDTLYVHSLRQFYINCLVAGTVDFIFGNGAVVLQDCDIHARRPNSGQKNMITAQGRTDPNQNTGIVIQKSRISATSDLLPVKSRFPTFLGRPWKQYSRTVIMQSSISSVIVPAGWSEWEGAFALDTLFYAEYLNTGPGARTSGRVKWKGYRTLMSASEAAPFTVANFFAGSSWLRHTGFPFSVGF
ncbi:hypothetical protein C5167_027160 [Papaver somniferum]|uniref:pectinesterase-like n=1 Tax=Papaver somniferum TaxID=3469 RepID=UPI000E6F61E1|nr:pectinesterase-like [Papaver somniferum]RZC89617.1 hypothetical protein C5167_027160 [Papaver somniferum]